MLEHSQDDPDVVVGQLFRVVLAYLLQLVDPSFSRIISELVYAGNVLPLYIIQEIHFSALFN